MSSWLFGENVFNANRVCDASFSKGVGEYFCRERAT